MQLPLETEGRQQQQQAANQNREAILVFIDVFLQLSWRQYSLDRVLDCLKDSSRVPQMGYLGYNRSACRNLGDTRHDTPL